MQYSALVWKVEKKQYSEIGFEIGVVLNVGVIDTIVSEKYAQQRTLKCSAGQCV